MEKKKKSKIQKWDEVVGLVETEVEESVSDPSESGNPVISRDQNPLRAVEDAVEQNDNSFDGIINNMPDDKPTAQITREDGIEAEQKKKSVLEELNKETPEAEKATPVPRCFSCTEREIK